MQLHFSNFQFFNLKNVHFSFFPEYSNFAQEKAIWIELNWKLNLILSGKMSDNFKKTDNFIGLVFGELLATKDLILRWFALPSLAPMALLQMRSSEQGS